MQIAIAGTGHVGFCSGMLLPQHFDFKLNFTFINQ
jgi:hypothetical protein